MIKRNILISSLLITSTLIIVLIISKPGFPLSFKLYKYISLEFFKFALKLTFLKFLGFSPEKFTGSEFILFSISDINSNFQLSLINCQLPNEINTNIKK